MRPICLVASDVPRAWLAVSAGSALAEMVGVALVWLFLARRR